MKVVSTQVAFVDGKRIRPGVVFEIADGHKLGAGMTMVEDGKSAKKAGGQADSKPAEAAAAAAAKQKAGQGDGTGGDTKPADAQAAAAKKAGGQA